MLAKGHRTLQRAPRRLVAALTGVALALTLVAGQASATMFSRERYSFDYEFTFTDCGYTMDVVGHREGILQIRTGKGKFASAFFAHDNYQFTEVGTRRDTGDFITLSANGLFQETKAIHVSGTIFDFRSINAGQPFTIRDSDGNVVSRDRGVIKEVLRFDTLGDDAPGGEFIEEISFSFAGPHPGFELDLCPLLA
jgi:hypothetical protein